MENENHQEKKRRVSRQFWKPNRFLSVLYGIWMGVYGVLKVALGALLTVLVIGIVCAVVFVGVLADYLEGDIVPISGVQLEGFDLSQPSYLYYLDSSDNIQVLQKLYAETDSEWADFEEIPEKMIYAAVAIEDHRFFEHQGVDWFTTIKACINMFVGSGDQFGGSSITQQLIKNMLLTEDTAADDVTVQRKVLEIFRATYFEEEYDKSVVLEWYLNYIFLGNRCTGVKTAAETYFGKELEDLSVAECACIISITNNPTIYNPISDKEITYDGETKTAAEWNKERRENILWRMHNLGYLTDEEYEQGLLDSENLVFKDGIDFKDRYSDCPTCGYHGHNDTYILENGVYYCPDCENATAIGEDATQNVYSWFVDVVIEDVIAEMAAAAGVELTEEATELYRNLITKGGYHIYTTLDMEAQTAVDTIYTNLDEIPTTSSVQQLQSGIVIIDNKTGDIVAVAGGVGEKTVFDAFSCATDAKLQPGSSIKPLTIYAPAFELGAISPATVVSDMPLYYNVVDEDRELAEGEEPELTPYPKNDSKTYSYSRNILSAIRSSINGVAVKTLDSIGVEYSFDFAYGNFGLTHLVKEYVNSNGAVLSDLGLSPLGMGAPTVGVTVRQMATAYATFANNGIYREARTFTHVYNSNGELVLYNDQDYEQILSQKTVNYINYCLDEAVDSGTGWAADITGQNVAGKTGTTTSNKDRWFCGYTEYYTASVWCGYKYQEVIVLTGSDQSNPACRLFKKVMTPLHEGKEAVDLYDTSEFVWVGICQDSGLLATDGCAHDRGGRVMYAYAYPEDIPTESCDKHIQVDYCTSCNAASGEYCHLFAQEGLTTISKTWLVKLTQKEVDDIVLAGKHGLESSYLNDSYVYLVDDNGNPSNFHGMQGDANVGVESPYVVCTVHTKEAWEAYQAANQPPEEDVEIPDVITEEAPDDEDTTQ